MSRVASSYAVVQVTLFPRRDGACLQPLARRGLIKHAKKDTEGERGSELRRQREATSHARWLYLLPGVRNIGHCGPSRGVVRARRGAGGVLVGGAWAGGARSWGGPRWLRRLKDFSKDSGGELYAILVYGGLGLRHFVGHPPKRPGLVLKMSGGCLR